FGFWIQKRGKKKIKWYFVMNVERKEVENSVINVQHKKKKIYIYIVIFIFFKPFKSREPLSTNKVNEKVRHLAILEEDEQTDHETLRAKFKTIKVTKQREGKRDTLRGKLEKAGGRTSELRKLFDNPEEDSTKKKEVEQKQN